MCQLGAMSKYVFVLSKQPDVMVYRAHERTLFCLLEVVSFLDGKTLNHFN